MKAGWNGLKKGISDFFVEYFTYELPGLTSNLHVSEP